MQAARSVVTTARTAYPCTRILFQRCSVVAAATVRCCAQHRCGGSSHRLRLSLQLQQQQRGRTAVCPPARAAGGDSGGDLDEIMRQDLERFKLKQQQQQQQQQQTQAAPASGSADTKPAGTSGLSEAVDKLLIADFFFVLAVLGWLAVGLVERGALGSSRLLGAWMPLWPLVFQPAIGLLMAGALASGGLRWLADRQQGSGPT